MDVVKRLEAMLSPSEAFLFGFVLLRRWKESEKSTLSKKEVERNILRLYSNFFTLHHVSFKLY